MRKTLIKTGCIFLLLTFVLPSCMKDNFDFNKLAKTDWEPSIAVPLVSSTFDVYDLMAYQDSSDLIVIDSLLRLLALVYKGDLISFSASDIIALPDQTTSQSFNLDIPEIAILTSSGSFTKSSNYTYTFTTTSGVKIDSLFLKTGNIGVDISSDFQNNGSLQIKMPSLSKDGNVFDKTISINYTGSPVTVSQSYDIADYKLDMTNGGTSFNEIPIELTFTINSGGTVSASNSLDINLSFNNLTFSKVFGDFGQQIIGADKDSILISLFNEAVDGAFVLVNPKLKIYISNSFGFPIDIEFTTLESVNIPTGQVTPFTFNGFANPFSISYPTIAQMNKPQKTNLVIDKTNSNIITLMTPTPKYLVHEIQATSNPAGIPTIPNFITDTSKFEVNTELELTLEGYAYNWMLIDTLDFTLEQIDSIQELKSITLRAIFTNGFPINARMQILLADSNYNVIDSLLTDRYDNLISSGQINSEGRVIKPTTKITDIYYDNSRVSNLTKGKYVIIWGKAETIDYISSTNVNIFEEYKLDVKLGIKADLKVSF